MALDLGEISVRLSAEDQLTAALNGAEQAARRTDQVTAQAATGITSSTRQMATQYQQLSREAETYATAARTAHSRAETATEAARLAQERLDDAQRDTTTSAEQLDRAQRGAAEATGAAERAIRQAEQANDRMVASHRRAARAAEAGGRDAEQAMERLQQEMRNTERVAESSGDEAGSGFADRFTSGIEGVAGSAEGAGASTGGSFIAGFAPRIASIGTKAGPIGAALAGVAVLGLSAGGVLADAIADGMRREQQNDVIQAQLGIDEATMGRLGAAAGAAYGNVFGESVNANLETGRGLFDFNLIDAGSTEAEIQNAIERVEVLNTMLGEETPETLRGLGGLVNSGLVGNIDEAADLIAQARTLGMNSQGDLIDSLSEYSAGWKNTGLSAQMSLGLINQSMEGGADNTDRAADALREFGRRISEEGDTMIGTFDNLGFAGEDMYAAFKRGGPDAEAAFDQVFDKIRSIKDPVERNKAAMSLLGDTAGDFIGVLAEWDPSGAVTSFGQVDGAAQRSADMIGNNAATKFEQAKRSIELSMSGIKFAIAEGFGPSLDKFADWVNTHQPEILGFFTRTGDAIFGALDAFLAFAEGSLRAGATMADAFGSTFGEILGLAGHVGETFGSILKHIPGMRGTGEALEGVGKAAQNYSEGAHAAADKSRVLADLIKEELRPGISNVREDFGAAGEAAVRTAELTRALGDEVHAVPDGKSIIIDSNSPEQQRQLEALGLKVETLPDGKFRVTSNTADGQQAIDDFIRANNGKSVNMYVDLEQRRRVAELAPQVADGSRTYGSAFSEAFPVREFASGGFLPEQAEIRPGSGAGVVQKVRWAEGETGKEGFVPMAPSKRPRSVEIVRQIANEFGYGLVEMADGGVISPQQLDSFSQGIEGANYVFGGWNGTWETDCSGAASRVTNYAVSGDPDSLGRFATGNQGEALASRGFKQGYQDGALNAGWLNGGPGGGHTSITLPNGVNVEMGGNRGDGQYGGQARAASTFPNIMPLPMQGDPDPGAFDTGAVGNLNAPATAEGASTIAPTSSGYSAGAISTSSGPIDVRVVNFADMKSSDALPDGRIPKMVGNLRVFANGGIESQDPEIAATGGPVRVWAEPQAGPWESYIPGDPAKHTRAVDIWRETGKRLNVQEFADGGFGGYTDPKARDYMKPTNLYEAAALATGVGFTAASGIGNYLSMAQSGTVDLSKLMPQFDTGSNDIPGLGEAVIGHLDTLVEQHQELIKTLQEGGIVTANVDVDTSNGSIGLDIMKTGLA